ncbi:hypothetical protein O3G_MSEX000054 [Manduca sexta]|nr:hypothetical protein O3G_MSEX000054 [Manduca sexta]
MPFQAVATVSATCQPRSRPVMRVGMYDTGAKQLIARDSLRIFLCKNNHVFLKVHYDFKFVNGVTNSDIVETALVDVTVQGVVAPTQFVALPGATESLLGINFVGDAGMVLDFRRDIWSLRNKPGSFPLEYEDVGTRIVSSTIDLLREDEATRLTVGERVRLSNVLDIKRDIFETGGAATSFAVHRIDTGDHPLISVPPYRVTPAKKNILKKEIDKSRREVLHYQMGDLILLESHRLSSCAQGYTAKFGPRREGPYHVRRLVSPTSYEIEDRDVVLLGKYHVSSLTPYLAKGELVSRRKRDRLLKIDAKSRPRRSRDLEGEAVM